MNGNSGVAVRTARLSVLLVVLVVLVGCTQVQWISDYDAYTDEEVGKLQRKTEELWTALERRPTRPDCAYASHLDFYEKATVDLNVLIARNAIRPLNTITSNQLELLKSSLETLEELHTLADTEERCLSAEETALLRTGFDTAFSAILKLELAKKRGEE